MGFLPCPLVVTMGYSDDLPQLGGGVVSGAGQPLPIVIDRLRVFGLNWSMGTSLLNSHVPALPATVHDQVLSLEALDLFLDVVFQVADRFSD